MTNDVEHIFSCAYWPVFTWVVGLLIIEFKSSLCILDTNELSAVHCIRVLQINRTNRTYIRGALLQKLAYIVWRLRNPRISHVQDREPGKFVG